MLSRKLKQNNGFSLAETLVYISIMTVLMIIIVNIVIAVSDSNKRSLVYNNIKNSSISGMEKIIREIRASNSFSIINSGSEISLNSKDDNGVAKVTRFYVDNNVLKIDVNGSYYGPLTMFGTKISSINFKSIDTGNSKAIKILLNINGENNGFSASEKIYSTIVLKNSY